MNLNEYIKAYRKKNRLSQRQLGINCGLSHGYISLIEKGINPRTKEKLIPTLGVLKKLAVGMDISLTELMSEVEDMPVNIGAHSVSYRLPVLGSVPAGIPLEAIEDIVDYEEISAKCANSDKEFFALKVKGDSMSPKYLEDDTIILERCEDVESGTDAVVYVNGFDATLKKVIKKPDCIILQPINPVYDPIVIDYGRDGDPVRIIGKVIELRRRFRL